MTDAPGAAPGSETAENRKSAVPRARDRQRSRPVTLLLQVGAVATALGSISGLVFGIVHAIGGVGGGGQAVAPPAGHVRLSLPAQSVHRLTFGEWMTANELDTKYAPRGQIDDVGVTVDYELQAPGYSRGATLPVRFRVFHQTTAGRDAFVDEFQDPAQLEVDSDSCTCTSSFIPIPRTKSRYRIEIQVFRPGPKTHSPLKKAYTESFLGFG